MALMNSGGSPSPAASAPDAGAQAGANAFLSAQAGAGTGGGKVYMGQTPGSGYVSPYAPSTGRGGGPKPITDIFMTAQEADASWYGLGKKQQRDFIAQGIVAGLLKSGDGTMEGFSLWKKLVTYAQQAYASGAKVSPMDVLASYLGGSTSGIPKFRTATQTQTDFTDPTTAKAIATNAFQQLLGRDPGQGELAGFASALHAAEAAAPTVTTTTNQYDTTTGDIASQDTTTSGGLSADARNYLAEQQIKGSKEYGAVQAGTTYANALEKAVYGSPS